MIDVDKRVLANALNHCRWLRKRVHGIWQVGVGTRMFRHQSTDAREDLSEVQQVQRAHRPPRGQREFQNHEVSAWPQDARHLREPRIHVRQVPDAKCHHCAVERRIGKRQLERVGPDGADAWLLVLPHVEHRYREVRADDVPGESGAATSNGSTRN